MTTLKVREIEGGGKNLADDILKMGLGVLLRIIKHLDVAPPNDYPEGEWAKMKTFFLFLMVFDYNTSFKITFRLSKHSYSLEEYCI